MSMSQCLAYDEVFEVQCQETDERQHVHRHADDGLTVSWKDSDFTEYQKSLVVIQPPGHW